MNKTTLEQLDELTKALDAKPYLQQGDPCQMQDLYPTYREHFNISAQQAFDKPKATSQVRQVPGTSDIEMAMYFSVIAVGRHNIPKAVDMIIKEVNKYAEHVIRPLEALGCIELAHTSYGAPTDFCQRYVVYSFPIFTMEGVKIVEADKSPLLSNEGTLSYVTVEDEPVLPPADLATHVFEISLTQTMQIDFPAAKLVQDRENLLLSFLPRGTKVVSVESGTVYDLSMRYQFVLKHPFFEPGMTIELIQEWIAWKNGDRIEQEDILVGINYRRQDGSIRIGSNPTPK